MKTLKIKKIDNNAIIPQYAHPGDAGLDLFSIEKKIIPAHQSTLIKTGLTIELPEQTEAQIRPRSGLALKQMITLLNSPGTIDEGYRGEICVIMINHNSKDFLITKGMKIAQMIIAPVLKVNIEEVNELTSTSRGEGGFGSTGIHEKNR